MKFAKFPAKAAASLLPALAGSLFAYSAAFAQSTGTAQLEEVVVTAASAPKGIDGVLAETQPKARTTITQEYIARQSAGQTILQTLNLSPGLNFTNNDPYGSSGGNIRLRSFDGSRISLTFDGIPLNDTGNYAIYGNQQLDAELIAQANVITGATDVDTPTISSTGGVINYTVRRPSDKFGVTFAPSVGSFDYRRFFGMVDTGEIGPWGTKAWFSASYQKYDKFKGSGSLEKKQYNARIWQDLWKPGDFVSLSVHWNENRNWSIYAPNLGTSDGSIVPETSTYGWKVDYDDLQPGGWKVPTAVKGSADPDPNTNNWWGGRINPSNTGNIRFQSRYTIAKGLIFTLDPSFQYTLANGGTQVVNIKENDPKLVGAATTFPTCQAGQKGVDLNGDGDCLDTVRYMSPSNTNTRRYGVNTSLIWEINHNNTLRLAYTYDRGRHRQTGEASYIDQNTGFVSDWFGGKDGHGQKIYTADGSFLRYRDRYSVAELSQLALEYRGRFFDDRLNLTLGLQDKEFSRELNQFCYTQNGSSTVLCTTEKVATTLANGDVKFASSTNEYIPPFAYSTTVHKTLPNVGVSWKFDKANQVYFSYSEQISALKTDSYYTVQRQTDGTIRSLNAAPEATKTYEAGYRYQTPNLIGAVSVYKTDFRNRVVSTYDPDTDTYRERNVGSVEIKGVEGSVGVKPVEHLSLMANVTYTDAQYQDPLLVKKPDIYAPIQGKQLVETPKWMWGGRAQYDLGDFSFGVQTKYVGRRFVTDMNDMSVKPYQTIDLDARVKLDRVHLKNSYLQLNIWNLFDSNYYGSLGTQVTGNPTLKTLYGVSSQPYGYIGAPRTVQLSLRAVF